LTNLGNFQRKDSAPTNYLYRVRKDRLYFVEPTQVFLINLYTRRSEPAATAGIIPLYVIITPQKCAMSLTDQELIIVVCFRSFFYIGSEK